MASDKDSSDKGSSDNKSSSDSDEGVSNNDVPSSSFRAQVDHDDAEADGLLIKSNQFVAPGPHKKEKNKQMSKKDNKRQDADPANKGMPTGQDKQDAGKEVTRMRAYEEPDDSIGYRFLTKAEIAAMNDIGNEGDDKSPGANQPRNLPYDGYEEWTLRNMAYIAWRQRLLFKILTDPVDNKFPHPIDPDATPEPEIEPLNLGVRLFKFFETMFPDKIEEIARASNRVSDSLNSIPGKQICETYQQLTDKDGLALQPVYRLCEVFSSPLSPFFNFSLATAAVCPC